MNDRERIAKRDAKARRLQGLDGGKKVGDETTPEMKKQSALRRHCLHRDKI
jgi:hypothetical protein